MKKSLRSEDIFFAQLFRWLIENDIPPGDVFERLIMEIIKKQEKDNNENDGKSCR